MIMLFCADCSFVLWADMAAANGKLSMVKLLASREIDHRWTIRDKVGQTPMQLAKAHGHADIISFFSSMVQNQMAQLNKLHDAGALDDEELASALRPLLLQQAEGGHAAGGIAHPRCAPAQAHQAACARTRQYRGEAGSVKGTLAPSATLARARPLPAVPRTTTMPAAAVRGAPTKGKPHSNMCAPPQHMPRCTTRQWTVVVVLLLLLLE